MRSLTREAKEEALGINPAVSSAEERNGTISNIERCRAIINLSASFVGSLTPSFNLLKRTHQ